MNKCKAINETTHKKMEEKEGIKTKNDLIYNLQWI